eukprot:5752926-Pyramimonas_sp.AAC.1
MTESLGRSPHPPRSPRPRVCLPGAAAAVSPDSLPLTQPASSADAPTLRLGRGNGRQPRR